MRSALCGVWVFALLPRIAGAQEPAVPVVVVPDWRLTRIVEFRDGIAAHYNRVDRRLYVGRRFNPGQGLYRIEPDGTASAVWTGDYVAGVVVDEAGNVFTSDDFSGELFHTSFGEVGRAVWVHGFHSGDDDPVGLAIAPPTYDGSVVLPGEGLVVDRGNNGVREVWRWLPESSEGERRLHAEDGTLTDPVDVAIGQSHVYLVDTGGPEAGAIYEIRPGGGLRAIPLIEAVDEPTGIAVDRNGALIVLDSGSRGGTASVLRIDPDTGSVRTMFRGFDLTIVPAWAGIDVLRSGRRIIVTDGGANRIYEFTKTPGDFDLDGDVDLADFLWMAYCIDDAGVPAGDGCADADFDRDDDVDLADLIAFQAAYTGAQ